MKIVNNLDFENWNKSVNHATQQCDLQDVFARSNLTELKCMFLDQSKSDKHLSIFAINKCMGAETMLQFVHAYSRHTSETYINEYEDTEGKELDTLRDALTIEKAEFESEKTEVKATIKALQSLNRELKKDNDTMSIETAKLYNRIQDLELELIDTKAELDKQWAFESHIKELLNN